MMTNLELRNSKFERTAQTKLLSAMAPAMIVAILYILWSSGSAWPSLLATLQFWGLVCFTSFGFYLIYRYGLEFELTEDGISWKRIFYFWSSGGLLRYSEIRSVELTDIPANSIILQLTSDQRFILRPDCVLTQGDLVDNTEDPEWPVYGRRKLMLNLKLELTKRITAPSDHEK